MVANGLVVSTSIGAGCGSGVGSNEDSSSGAAIVVASPWTSTACISAEARADRAGAGVASGAGAMLTGWLARRGGTVIMAECSSRDRGRRGASAAGSTLRMIGIGLVRACSSA